MWIVVVAARRAARSLLARRRDAAAEAEPADASSGGACVHRDEAKKRSTRARAGRTLDVGRTARSRRCRFQSRRRRQDLKKGDQQIEAGNADVRRCRRQRDERKSALKQRVARAPRHRDPGPRAPLRVDRPRTRRTARSSLRRLAEDYVELETAAFRDKTAGRDQARRAEEDEPAEAAGQQQTQRQPGRAAIMKAARKKADRATTRSSTNDYPNYAAARRGPLLPRVRVRAGERLEQRAHGLLRAHPEGAELEVHPERVPRVRRALLQRSAGRPDASGTSPRRPTRRSSSTRRRTTRSTATPATSSRYVFWNKGEFDKALNEFKKTIEFGVSYAQLPNAAQLADSARRDVIPVYALAGDPDAGLQLLQDISGDPAGVERQDVQDDGRPRAELPRHRSLPRGDRRSTRT